MANCKNLLFIIIKMCVVLSGDKSRGGRLQRGVGGVARVLKRFKEGVKLLQIAFFAAIFGVKASTKQKFVLYLLICHNLTKIYKYV